MGRKGFAPKEGWNPGPELHGFEPQRVSNFLVINHTEVSFEYLFATELRARWRIPQCPGARYSAAHRCRPPCFRGACCVACPLPMMLWTRALNPSLYWTRRSIIPATAHPLVIASHCQIYLSKEILTPVERNIGQRNNIQKSQGF
jgi:hypothetical protein